MCINLLNKYWKKIEIMYSVKVLEFRKIQNNQCILYYNPLGMILGSTF